MMKRYLARIILTLMTLSMIVSLVPHHAAAAGYRVVIDGRAVDGAQPEIKDGQLAVAARPFIEAMGGVVTWKDASQQILMEHNDSQVSMWIGNRLSFQDGERFQAPFAPYFRNGKTMAPAWWLAARFGMKVAFDGSTLSVTTHATQVGQGLNSLYDPSYFFPFSRSAKYEAFYNTWGDGRTYQGRNFGHEGVDILAPKGTPLIAVASGKIVRYGWNTLGGYRLNIEVDGHPGYRFYYAHMDRYASGIYLGAHVTAGQVIGYVGNTGEGPERTEGKFVTHLHFGMYQPDWTATNPYQYLKYWEKHKVQW